MSNESAPHTAILFIKVEMHKVLSTGELAGEVTEAKRVQFAIEGQDKNDCQKKLEECLQGVKKWSRK